MWIFLEGEFVVSPVKSIISRALRKEDDRVNVITFPTHERYQSNLRDVNANFYMVHGTPGVKENGWISQYASMPNNHILLPKSEDPLSVLPPDVEFHCVVSQHRFGQYQTAHQLSKILHIPHINLEHTWAMPFWSQQQKDGLRKLSADIDIFISEQSRDIWGWNENNAEVIRHGVDTNLFKPMKHVNKKPQVLSIVNDWVNRGDILGFDIWQKVVKDNFPWLVRGDTRGLSTVPQNTYELVQNYNESSVFFNTSRYSPIPSVILEAMACGLPVVTTDNCLITEVIQDGYNGFKTNDENIMRQKIGWLLENPEAAKQMGENARHTIQQMFPLNVFTSKWESVLYQAANMLYKP